jgi:hypothetical protein
LAPKPAPAPNAPAPSASSPTSTPSKPALRDLADKLKRLDDEDLEIEDLPDDVGRDRRR